MKQQKATLEGYLTIIVFLYFNDALWVSIKIATTRQFKCVPTTYLTFKKASISIVPIEVNPQGILTLEVELKVFSTHTCILFHIVNQILWNVWKYGHYYYA